MADTDYSALAEQVRNKYKKTDKPTGEVDYSALADQVRKGKAPAASTDQDFTKGEGGLYKMYGRTGKGEEVGEISIPYSRVEEAQKSGYTFHGNEAAEKYHKDKEFEGKSPSLVGRMEEGVHNFLEPKPNEEHKNALGFKEVGIGTTDVTNTLRAYGRVFAGLPEYLGEVAKAAKNSIETHDSSELVNLIDPLAMPKNLYDQFQKDWKSGDHSLAIQNLLGSIGGMATVGKATHVAEEAGGAIKDKVSETAANLPEHARGFAQSITRTGPTVMRNLVDETLAENDAKRTAYNEARAEAEHEHQGKMIEHQVGEDAKKRAAIDKHNEALTAAHRENIKKFDEWQDQHDKIDEENKAAEHLLEARRQTEAELKEKTDAYYAKENELKFKAKKDENEAWKPWRDKVKDVSVDTEELRGKISAMEKKNPEVARLIRELPEDVGDVDPNSRFAIDREGIVKGQGYTKPYNELPDDAKARIDDLVNRMGLKPEAKDFDFDKDEMSIEDLHRAKSILGLKLAKGDYEGFVKGEMEKLYDLLQNEEASASLRAGASEELLEAKEATKRYHDTFGRERTVRKTKGETRKAKANPEQYKQEQEEERLAQTTKHFPELEDAHKDITSVHDKLKEMKAEDELRKSLKQLPEAPKPEELKPYPKFEEPVPDRPPLKNEPKRPKYKSIGAEELSAANKAKYRDFLEKLPQRATYVLATLPAIRIGSALTHLKFGQAALDLIYVATAAPFAVAGLNKLAELIGNNDDITRWITEPTTEDLMKLNRLLPPEMQQEVAEGLQKVAVAAKKKGIKISPLIIAFISAHKPAKKDQKPEQAEEETEETPEEESVTQ
jgi:hypothetical protein